jgi:hypothetical protein
MTPRLGLMTLSDALYAPQMAGWRRCPLPDLAGAYGPSWGVTERMGGVVKMTPTVRARCHSVRA